MIRHHGIRGQCAIIALRRRLLSRMVDVAKAWMLVHWIKDPLVREGALERANSRQKGLTARYEALRSKMWLVIRWFY